MQGANLRNLHENESFSKPSQVFLLCFNLTKPQLVDNISFRAEASRRRSRCCRHSRINRRHKFIDMNNLRHRKQEVVTAEGENSPAHTETLH